MQDYQEYYQTPLGLVQICAKDSGITKIAFADAANKQRPNVWTTQCIRQLQEYFDGLRNEFTLPLVLEGTAFQKKVWTALCKIPYGETRSYQDIARMIDQPKACRAVGMANNRNPIVIVIPCHRVIGKNKTLVGYGGGLKRKEYLLKLEKNVK